MANRYRIPGLETTPPATTTLWYINEDGIWTPVAGTFGDGKVAQGQSDGTIEWVESSALAGPFSLAFPFFASSEILITPFGRFTANVVGWAVRLDASGSATFAVEHAATITGSFSDMVGGGTAPTVSSAVGAEALPTSGWTSTSVASGGVLRVTCSALTTATQATLTLHFERT